MLVPKTPTKIASWNVLGGSWGPFDASWRRLRAVLEASWGVLGGSWERVGRLWDVLFVLEGILGRPGSVPEPP